MPLGIPGPGKDAPATAGSSPAGRVPPARPGVHDNYNPLSPIQGEKWVLVLMKGGVLITLRGSFKNIGSSH